MDEREQSNVKRSDFLQQLIELKNKGYLEDPDSKNDPEKEGMQIFFRLCVEETNHSIFSKRRHLISRFPLDFAH